MLEMATREAFAQSGTLQKLASKPNPAYLVMDKTSAYQDATTYNKFYEFGTDKSEPARNAGTLAVAPVVATASCTVLNTGSPICSLPPFPGVAPPTI